MLEGDSTPREAPEAAGAAAGQHGFRILSETRAYNRYIQVEHRRVAYPDGREVDFDIVGHPKNSFHFVVVFAFDSASRTITVIREFAQAALPHSAVVLGLPCGGFDGGKHTSRLHAAQCELSEEAQLTGGTWHSLLPEAHPGILEGKWSRNRFTPFLCIDPVPDKTPGEKDAEEHISAQQLSVEEVRQACLAGDMLLPSMQACVSAFAWLESCHKIEHTQHVL
ncbi:hypothetical protein AB1Y20_022225 [Prymnesium parvum]|uniref:Nudix hydrolase domain-containing protein n=1 Tax=Prymnesium parvum TaxID=97485 RepID=A0AB34JGK3_PRYPA